MDNGIFRPEALEFQRRRLAGVLEVSPTQRSLRLGFIVLVCSAAFLALLVCIQVPDSRCSTDGTSSVHVSMLTFLLKRVPGNHAPEKKGEAVCGHGAIGEK